jgi:hypothetical protein
MGLGAKMNCHGPLEPGRTAHVRVIAAGTFKRCRLFYVSEVPAEFKVRYAGYLLERVTFEGAKQKHG